MSEVKAGDRVVLPMYVAFVHDPTIGLTPQPERAKAGVGCVVAMSDEVAPWHDALPAVARWLAETPDAVDLLKDALWIAIISKQDLFGLPSPELDAERNQLQALVAALATGAVDGGAG